MFARELLYVVLAKHSQAEIVCFMNDFRAELLRHGNKSDFLATSPRPPNGVLDALFQLLDSFSKHSVRYHRHYTALMKIAVPKDAFVLLIGAAGSGKTTFAAKNFRSTQVLSSD